MKFWPLFLLAFLLPVASPAFAAQGVLPPSFGEWTVASPQTQVAPQDLEQFVGNAALLREDGITVMERGDYAQGDQKAAVAVYRMTDPSAALAAFMLLRDPKMTALSLGPSVAYGAAQKERALVVVGNFLVDISSAMTRPPDQDLRILADSLRPRSDHSPYPIIQGFLPKNGMVANSERYVLGKQGFAQAFPIGAVNQRDWLGFDKSAEAIIAQYHLPGEPKDKPALLMIALYPTQQVAADAYNTFSGWVNLNGNAASSDAHPVVFGKRSGALIALIADTNSSQAANALLDQVQYSSQVTWNEPSFDLTEPGIGTMVVGAIMGTGSIMVLALVAGIGFGGVRLFTKILLPGRVFDRNEQVEILQLGISSKPIEAKDFYAVKSSRES